MSEYRQTGEAGSGEASEAFADRHRLPLRGRYERVCHQCVWGDRNLRNLAAGDLYCARGRSAGECGKESLLELRTRKRTREYKVHSMPYPVSVRYVPSERRDGKWRPRESGRVLMSGGSSSCCEHWCPRFPPMGSASSAPAAVKHDAMIESARRIASKEIDVESWSVPQQILPILNNLGISAGGCGNCGHH